MNELENDEIVDLLDEEYKVVELTDDSISQEYIDEMKMLGEPKPQQISWERWNRLKNERIEHQHMIHMAARGMPQKAIAEALGYQQAHVSKILNTPAIKEKVRSEVTSIYGGEDLKKMLSDRFFKSMFVADEILDTGKESEKASMAKFIIEHTVGKAQQTTEHKVTMLADIQMQIQKMEELRIVNSTPQAPDPFDTIIDEVITKGYIVGKRNVESTGEKAE